MLNEHIPQFDDCNSFLYMILGLLVRADSMDRMLTELTPPVAHGPPDSEPIVLLPSDQQLVEFVLGLISFRATFVAIIERSALPDRPEPLVGSSDTRPVATSRSMRALFR